MGDFKQVEKALLFYDPLKRKIEYGNIAQDRAIKKDSIKTIPWLIYYVKLHMVQHLISALILETK